MKDTLKTFLTKTGVAVYDAVDNKLNLPATVDSIFKNLVIPAGAAAAGFALADYILKVTGA